MASEVLMTVSEEETASLRRLSVEKYAMDAHRATVWIARRGKNGKS
ncbi:MAG: hypothetical protein LBT00_10485 [Spirochaetaceae bacterium]|jgi:hypothetical protein|nr:hypothetical protein [Spirochaetaceae bacterium]